MSAEQFTDSDSGGFIYRLSDGRRVYFSPPAQNSNPARDIFAQDYGYVPDKFRACCQVCDGQITGATIDEYIKSLDEHRERHIAETEPSHEP
jgi:hypothetical protein